MNPNPRIDQLTSYQFQPGNPGGPGRPGRPSQDAADNVLRMKLPDELRLQLNQIALPGGVRKNLHVLKEGCNCAAGAAWALMCKALAGNVEAFKELREAAEGRSGLRVEWLDAQAGAQPVVIELVQVFEPPVPGRNSRLAKIAPTASEPVIKNAIGRMVEDLAGKPETEE